MTNSNILCKPKPNKNITVFIIPRNVHSRPSGTVHHPSPFYQKFSWTSQQYRLRRQHRFFMCVSRHSLFLMPSPSVNIVFKRHLPPGRAVLAAFRKRVKYVLDTNIDPTGLSPDIRDFLSSSKKCVRSQTFFFFCFFTFNGRLPLCARGFYDCHYRTAATAWTWNDNRPNRRCHPLIFEYCTFVITTPSGRHILFGVYDVFF